MSPTPSDGGPAFPRDCSYPSVDGTMRVGLPGHNGMSLRDYFAGQVVGHITSDMLGDRNSFDQIKRDPPGAARALAVHRMSDPVRTDS